MDSQLEAVAKSYDRTLDLGKKGINLYKKLPEYITNDPDYPVYQRQAEIDRASGSGAVRDYLSPRAGMKFIDLGCSLNLMFRAYDEWPSTYYGVDISPKTIQLLNEFAGEKKLPVGALFCGSIHETPFDGGCFDIGACIGSLEYFERDFVEKAIIEAHRIVKPNGGFVLDVPNLGSPACRIMALIEEHLGRPDRFDMPPHEFETLLQDYFIIENATKPASGDMMLIYYLILIPIKTTNWRGG